MVRVKTERRIKMRNYDMIQFLKILQRESLEESREKIGEGGECVCLMDESPNEVCTCGRGQLVSN